MLNKFSKSPIIIAGCGRSGTTLLLSILSAHPSIFGIPFETKVFCSTAYEDQPKADPLIDLNSINQHFLEQEIPSGSRWCEKTPKNVVYIGRILEYFNNDVKIINIVRDGRDVILSRHPENPKLYWVTPQRWVNDVKAGLKFALSPQVLTIRYEDLVLDFDQTIVRILKFLNEDYHSNIDHWQHFTKVKVHEALFEKVQPIYIDSVGKWKDPIYRKRVEELMRFPDALEVLKYYQYVI